MGTSRRRKLNRPRKTRLDRLIEEAIVDAYGESEQAVGLYTMIEKHLALPLETMVLGVPVTVVRVDLTRRDEIVAVCRRAGVRQTVPILDLPLPSRRPAGAEWIDACRRWVNRRPVLRRVANVGRASHRPPAIDVGLADTHRAAVPLADLGRLAA
jgi:hypothetical protein